MSLVVRSRLARAGLVAGSLAAVVAAAATSAVSLLAVAVLLLLPVATSLSQAGRLAVSLQGLKRRTVSAIVWGAPIGGPEAGLRVESVGAVGAGLLISLRDGGGKTLLKVAQPRSWLVEGDRVVIAEAAYVQWAGHKLARVEGVSAVAIRSVASHRQGRKDG